VSHPDWLAAAALDTIITAGARVRPYMVASTVLDGKSLPRTDGSGAPGRQSRLRKIKVSDV
jgi:hypothetical protein